MRDLGDRDSPFAESCSNNMGPTLGDDAAYKGEEDPDHDITSLTFYIAVFHSIRQL